jgi:hypothetical protein
LQVKPSVLLFPAVVAGLVALIRVAMRRPERRRITPALAVLAVLAAALVAAALHLYPLMHRAALFLVAPMAVILAALPTLAGARVPRRPVLGQLLAVGLVASLAVLWTTANPSDGGGGRKVPAAPPLALVRAQLQPGDAVLLHVWASGAYRWYGGQLSLPSAQLVLPTRAGAPCSDRPAEERLAGSRRIWAVAIDQPSSGGRLSQEEFFEAVGRLGTPKSSYRFSSGARVVLYDPVLPTGVSPAEHSGPCPTFVARTPPPTTPRQPIWR